MIGKDTLHLKIPRDIEGNLLWRERILTESQKCPKVRKGILEACRRDILFWINTFAWQYNPTVKGLARVAPFVTYGFQEHALLDQPSKEWPNRKGIAWYYENDRTCVVEKSRKMGASWIFLLFEDWLCLFHDHTQASNVSRNADAVDDGTPDSLLWKIDYLHKHMPGWMTAGIDKSKMRFEYARTKSWIKGEASTGKALTGGRASVIFVDEFSLIREDKDVRERTASVAECRFFNGTHNGVASEFFAMTRSPEIGRQMWHWTAHPNYNQGLYSWDKKHGRAIFWRYDEAARGIVRADGPTIEYPPDFKFDTSGKPSGGPHPGIRSPWYDRKCEDIGNERSIAQELDVDPEGSGSQVFNPLTLKVYREELCRPPVWTGEIEYDSREGIPKDMIASPGGCLSLWVHLNGRNEPPRARHAIGADISQGTGASTSCLAVWNVATKTLVAEYASGAIDQFDLAAYCAALGRLFRDEDGNPARVVWEKNGPGGQFATELYRLGYRSFYWSENDNNPFMPVPTGKPGWFSSPESKDRLILDYQKNLSRRLLVNRSAKSVDECAQYVYGPDGHIIHPKAKGKSTDPSGAGGNHGDRVIAAALGWMLVVKMSGTAMLPVTETGSNEVKPGGFAWRMQWNEMQDAMKREVAWR